MKTAVLHLGFHKTGTKYLQLAVKDWLANQPRVRESIFYSSQRMQSSGWRDFRTRYFLRLRNRIAHAPFQEPPLCQEDLERNLNLLDVSSDFAALSEYLSRSNQILIHSDENSLGDVFGHCTYGPKRLWPFYPNGGSICTVFAAAAGIERSAVHIVLGIRNFREMAISSLKTAAKSARPFPPLIEFAAQLQTMKSNCRSIIEQCLRVPFIHRLHLFDHRMLHDSPKKYLERFHDLISSDLPSLPCPGRKVNESLPDSVVLDLLEARQVIAPHNRTAISSVAELLPPEHLARLDRDYEVFESWLLGQLSSNSKLMYYR